MKKLIILLGLGLFIIACKNEKTKEDTIMDQDSLLLDYPEPVPAIPDSVVYPEDTMNIINDTVPVVE